MQSMDARQLARRGRETDSDVRVVKFSAASESLLCAREEPAQGPWESARSDSERITLSQAARILARHRLGEDLHGSDGIDSEKTCAASTRRRLARHRLGEALHGIDSEKTCTASTRRRLARHRLGRPAGHGWTRRTNRAAKPQPQLEQIRV